MKKIKLLILVVILSFLVKSRLFAYYNQLTPQQIQEAIRLGKMYKGNISILLNNLMLQPLTDSSFAVQFFTPFNQLVFLSACGENIDDKKIQEIIKNPKIFMVVYGSFKPKNTKQDLWDDNFLEIEGEYFDRYVYGISGLSGKVGQQIYNTILQAGLYPYELTTFEAIEFEPDAVVNYYLPSTGQEKTDYSLETLPQKVTFDLSLIE